MGNEKYRVIEMDPLKICFDGELARKLRDTEIDDKLYRQLRDESNELVSHGDVRMDFVKGCCLLYSVGWSVGGTPSTYIERRQKEYFDRDDWKTRNMPLSFLAEEGDIVYVTHNGNEKINKVLLRLWENWFERVKDV